MSRIRVPDRELGYAEKTAMLGQWRAALDCRIRQPPSNSARRADKRQVARLPQMASTFFTNQWEEFGKGPYIRLLFLGIRDTGSTLYALEGLDNTVVRHVYSYITSQLATRITRTIPASCIANSLGLMVRYSYGRADGQSINVEPIHFKPKGGYVSFVSCGTIEFPDPAGRKITMMPFRFGDRSSIPDEFQAYYDCIEMCPYPEETVGQVGYLTINEGFVKNGSYIQRKGLHIERPEIIEQQANGEESCAFSPAPENTSSEHFEEPDRYKGGIYICSNVKHANKVWDALVDKNAKGLVEPDGGCEHLRKFIGVGTKLPENQLVWMTDRTPREEIAMKTSGHQQYFQVVASDISVWYENCYTQNPLVSIPEGVKIIKGD
mmetsp:Transcript_3591/g.4127  ORF Transcript_3591/g.4127 Transcript_3591/m.4127 type:complete len:378 (+) Transcript_3591:95-1228(+)